MKLAVRQQIERMCGYIGSDNRIAAYMRANYDARITDGQVTRIRRALPRQRVAGGSKSAEGVTCAAATLRQMDAERGSAALLRRQLLTGRDWITDRAQFRAACASVGIIA